MPSSVTIRTMGFDPMTAQRRSVIFMLLLLLPLLLSRPSPRPSPLRGEGDKSSVWLPALAAWLVPEDRARHGFCFSESARCTCDEELVEVRAAEGAARHLGDWKAHLPVQGAVRPIAADDAAAPQRDPDEALGGDAAAIWHPVACSQRD